MTVLSPERAAETNHRDPSVTPVPMRAGDGNGVCAVRGAIDGVPVVGYCTDATRMGGSIGGEGGRHIAEALASAPSGRGHHGNIPL